MLKCNIDLQAIDYNCTDCRVCSGKSILNYPFDRDLFNSDDLVVAIMKYVQENTSCTCKKTTIDKNPDINVFSSRGTLICRIEAKYLEGQAFMKSLEYIHLKPKEALVVDEPKLRSYFDCKVRDKTSGENIPIFIVWEYDRPCRDVGGIAVFQEIDILHSIYVSHGRERFFERKSSWNDFSGGTKLGVTRKYHFSISECRPIEELIDEINALTHI